MSLEKTIAAFNEFHFFKEFTYAINAFSRADGQEVELADAIVSLDNLMLVFQLKERTCSGSTTPEEEENWFTNKILKKATSQVKDTLKYLKDHTCIKLTNQRGHSIDLTSSAITQLHKIILYSPSDQLLSKCLFKKFYKSKTAGFIHLFPLRTYAAVVRKLLTPAEIADYFLFREALAQKWADEVLDDISEYSLIGQYLSGERDMLPSENFITFYEDLDHGAEDWDISGIIEHYQERLLNPSDNYYPILKELAKLNRYECREFKKRYLLAKEAAKEGRTPTPYRMRLRTGCGFIFISVIESGEWEKHLEGWALAHKYEQRLDKCIGIIFMGEVGEGWFDNNTIYLESPWEHDIEMEELLKRFGDLLRPVTAYQNYNSHGHL